MQRANNNEETRGLIFHSSILLDTPPRFPFGHCPPTIFNTTPRAHRACRCLLLLLLLLFLLFLLLLVLSSRGVFERWIRFNGVEPPPVGDVDDIVSTRVRRKEKEARKSNGETSSSLSPSHNILVISVSRRCQNLLERSRSNDGKNGTIFLRHRIRNRREEEKRTCARKSVLGIEWTAYQR